VVCDYEASFSRGCSRETIDETHITTRTMQAAQMETTTVVRVFHGTVVHSVGLDRLEVVPRAWLGVDAAGRVAFLHHGNNDLDRSALSLKYSLPRNSSF
jgi:hypothetical protein